MTAGGLVDGKHRPGAREIRSALEATKGEMWDALVHCVSDEYGAKGELVFGGAKYGWELHFRKGGRPLVSRCSRAGTHSRSRSFWDGQRRSRLRGWSSGRA